MHSALFFVGKLIFLIMYFTSKKNGTDMSLQERRQEKYVVDRPWWVSLICRVIFRAMRGGKGEGCTLPR
jgi:hypothetical protein